MKETNNVLLLLCLDTQKQKRESESFEGPFDIYFGSFAMVFTYALLHI